MNNDNDFAGITVAVRTPDVRESIFRHGTPYPWRRPGTKPVLGPLLSDDMALERELQEATRENQRRWSRQAHESMDLWTMQDYCEHTNPEDDEQYDNVEEFDRRVSRHEKWSSTERKLVVTNEYAHAFAAAARDQSTVYQDWAKAQQAFDDAHDGRICMSDPQGSVCKTCADIHEEGDDDFGYEPYGCCIEDDAREAYNDFWTANGDADWRTPTEPDAAAWLGRIAGRPAAA